MIRQAVIDIHDFRGRLAAAEMMLHKPLSERNRELILEFERKLMSEGLSTARVEKYVETLKRIAEMLGKDLDAATNGNIEDLVFRIERAAYSPWTKHDYKVVLKRFYKWLKGKTGSRRVIVVVATPYLQTWIQNHPLKNDPDAPLWVNLGTVNRFKAMSYPALVKILKVAASRPLRQAPQPGH
jgi:hypothetical protein